MFGSGRKQNILTTVAAAMAVGGMDYPGSMADLNSSWGLPMLPKRFTDPLPEVDDLEEEFILVLCKKSNLSYRKRQTVLSCIDSRYGPRWEKRKTTSIVDDAFDQPKYIERLLSLGTRELVAFRRGKNSEGKLYLTVAFRELKNESDVERLNELVAEAARRMEQHHEQG